MHTGKGERVRSEIFWHKDATKHEKGDPLDNMTVPPSKEFGQKPKDPPGFPTTVHLCFEVLSQIFWKHFKVILRSFSIHVQAIFKLLCNLKYFFILPFCKLTYFVILECTFYIFFSFPSYFWFFLSLNYFSFALLG